MGGPHRKAVVPEGGWCIWCTKMAGRGIRDSLRFLVKPGFADVTLRTVVVDLLTGVLGLRVSDILCLQDFPNQKLYDVTFYSTEVCWNTYEQFKIIEDSEVGRKFGVQPLFMQEEKVITVHLYNPFADINLVRAFLSSYCDNLRGGDKIFNNFQIWSGKYRFFGTFKNDSSCVGGVRRPPAVFTIGGERGFLFYPGQPRYCRKCMMYGHVSGECDQELKCRFCGKGGHAARDCKEGRVCDICHKPGHMAKQCGSYQAARKEWLSSVLSQGKEKREGRQRRPQEGAGGNSRGDSADAQADPSGVPPKKHPASDVAPKEQASDAEGSVGTTTATVSQVADGGVNPGSADVLQGEDGGPPGGMEEEGEGGGQAGTPHMVVQVDPGLGAINVDVRRRSSSFLGSLSDSDSEEEEEEMESDDSIECGQRMEGSSTPELLDNTGSKRARSDRPLPGGVEGEGVMPEYGGSEEESASSPVPRRMLRSQPGVSETENRMDF